MNINSKLKEYIEFRKYYIEQERLEEKMFHLREIYNFGYKRENYSRCITNTKGKKLQELDEIVLVRFGKKEYIKTDIKNNDIVLITDNYLGKLRKEDFSEFSKQIENFPYGNVDNIGKSFIDVWITKPYPKYIFDKNIDIHLYMNDVTYVRQEEALDAMKQRKTYHWKNMVSFLLGAYPQDYQEQNQIETVNFLNHDLNQYQKEFVENSLKNNYFSILHGPFGTGKTTSLVESIYQFYKQGKKVLVAADSNTAVDNILMRLDSLNIFNKNDIVRVGTMTRSYREEVYDYSIYKLIEEHLNYDRIKQITKDLDKYKKQQSAYKKPVPQKRRGLSDMQIHRLAHTGKNYRGLKSKDIQSMSNWLHINKKIEDLIEEKENIRNDIISEILDNAGIVLSTNSMIFSDLLKGYFFDVAVIDEASQSTEPSNIMPIVVSDKFIIAGDHKQLPPTVVSEKAKPLEKSLFERIVELYGSDQDIYNLLKVQYRMNNILMNFSSKMFYNGQLSAGEGVKNNTLKQLKSVKNLNSLKEYGIDTEITSLFWFDIKGDEKQEKMGKSYFNYYEIDKTKEIVDKLLETGINQDEIGVISPYSAQVNKLTSTFKDYDIEINTVDGFQGKEKELILISYVRSNKEQRIGFLNDYRRLNVAITRAKRLLINIGDFSTLETDDIYSQYFDYIKTNGKFISN